MNDIYDRAIAHYGDKKQLLQACEECAELIQAISKATRYTGKSYVDGVCEEIADVLIMCEQVKRIFNISTVDVEKEKERKLTRLERYIKTDEP
jgi:NTP pyrophosphatase (non-canonical NTP hydrolase)